MPQPPEAAAYAAGLAEVYRGVWQRLLEEQQALLADWPAMPRARRLQRLRELQQLVEQLAATVDEQALRFVVDDLPAVFLLGAAKGGATRSNGIDFDALAALARDTYDDLLAATSNVRRSSKTLVRTLTRQHVSDLLVRGQTAVEAGRALARDLADRGLTAVTYSNGARRGLGEYAEMVVRTKTAQAYNTGTLRALVHEGTGYVEVFDGAGCGWTRHDDGDKAHGSIRTVEQALAHPISHPHCTRSFGARPDLSTPEQAAAARGSTTGGQDADQSLVADARATAAARRSAAAAMQQRVQRNAARLLAEPGSRVTSDRYAQRIAARNARLDRARRVEARARRTRSAQ